MQLRWMLVAFAIILFETTNAFRDNFENDGRRYKTKKVARLGEARFTTAILNKLALKVQPATTTQKPTITSWTDGPEYTSGNGPSYTSGYGPSYTSGYGPSYTSGYDPSRTYTSSSETQSGPETTTGDGNGPGPGPRPDVTSSDTSLSPGVTSSSPVPGDEPATSTFRDPSNGGPNDKQPDEANNADPDTAFSSRALDGNDLFEDEEEEEAARNTFEDLNDDLDGRVIVLNGKSYLIYENINEDKINQGRAAPSRREQLRRRRNQQARRRRLQQQQFNRLTRRGIRRGNRRPATRRPAGNRRKSSYRRKALRQRVNRRRQSQRRRATSKRRRQNNGNRNRVYRVSAKPAQRIIIRQV